jgi:Na+-transporting NADH:ubiquinone oxidoreductase subunit D
MNDNGMRKALIQPLVGINPITLQILGICSALAVTKTLATALVMSAAVTAVLTLSNTFVSLIRHHMPRNVRLIIEITIICSLVIVVDQVLQAFAYGLARQLSVFVGLIVTNCIILARAEMFAMKNPVRLSAMDGLGNALGYSWVLIVVGSVRELLGTGELLGLVVLPTSSQEGWFDPLAIMLLPPSAFFIIGFLIWAIRSWQPAQAEAGAFDARPALEAGEER